MKRLLKPMLQNHPLRAPEGAAGTNGGAEGLEAKLAALEAKIAQLGHAAGQPDPALPTPTDPSVIKQAQDKAHQTDQRAQERARMQEAIKFNMGAQKFVDENKEFLTRLSPNILQTIAAKEFSDEELKARATQAALLEDFFSQQENMDAAPEELKARVLAFKALTSDEKEKQAPKYWDTLTLTLGQKRLEAKLEAARRANAGRYEETNDLIKNYNARVFALKSHYLGEKEQAK